MKKVARYFCFIFFSFFIFPLFSQTQPPDHSQTQSASQNQNTNSLTEQRIYVPYEKLEQAVKDQQGIFLPYSDFLKLWDEATRKPSEKILLPPPIEASVTEAKYEGIVQGSIVNFKGLLKITSLKDRWAVLPIKLKNIAITGIRLNDAPPIIHSTPEGFNLILQEKGDYELKWEFTTEVKTFPGKKIIQCQFPSSPLTQVDLVIPGTDLDIQVIPMLSKKLEEKEDETHLSAFLAPHGNLEINWLAKSETKELESIIFAKQFTELTVHESTLTLTSHIDLSVSQAKTGSFSIKIPEELNLVRVEGKNIKEWELENGFLLIELYEEILGDYSIKLITEMYREASESLIDYPSIKVEGVKREEGIIAIKPSPSLKIKVESYEHLTQIDPNDLKTHASGNEILFAYKYFRHPFRLPLTITKMQPQIRAVQKNRVLIQDTLIKLNANILYEIKDAGIFELQLRIPSGYRILEAGNRQSVDHYTVKQENDGSILEIFFKNRAFGTFELPLFFETDKPDSNYEILIPKIETLNTEKEEGIIAIYVKKNLKLNSRDVKSLIPIGLNELYQMAFPAEIYETELTSGYKYSQTNFSCFLDVEKRKSKQIAIVERSISLDETSIKIQDNIRYQILYAPVRSFRVEVPVAAGKEAIVSGENIKEKRFLSDSESSTGIWEIELHTPQMDSYEFRIETEKKISEMQTGEKMTLDIPTVKVLDVFNETGVIGISKSANLQIEAKEENLDPIDIKELPASMNRNTMFLAYRYYNHPYQLQLESIRHDYEKVLNALVTFAHYDLIVSEEGLIKTEAVFRIKNINRQSLDLKFPNGTEKIYSVFISGNKASLSKSATDREKILMLPKNIEPGKEFTLRIIYDTRLTSQLGIFGKLHLTALEVREVPILKIKWRLYLPSRFVYFQMDGSLNPEQKNQLDPINRTIPFAKVHSPIQINEREILKLPDEQNTFGALDVNLVREGKLFNLSKLDKNAFINVPYLKNFVFYQLSTILFLFCAAFTYLLSRKTTPLKILFFGGSFFLFLFFFIPYGYRYFFWLITLAVILESLAQVLMEKYKFRNQA